MAEQDLLFPQEVADWLRVDISTLYRWRRTWPSGVCKGPVFIELEPGEVRYYRSDVETYLETRKSTNITTASRKPSAVALTAVRAA
ncbi:helix-turn-helix transcriptional regulator [Canibacter oris]|uniref:Putative site-specific integrase-resolvase n=1 Tax=Canibacter oris TaxID=1365628 RepID=A0A840DNF3_9MICO|nr:helix-turn-helix domain-containing protein [Canibacter oris]MBB4071597.1 putative site-specific integrase-resolvase [Canibacter oris]